MMRKICMLLAVALLSAGLAFASGAKEQGPVKIGFYADLSAGSAYNALTRDPEFGRGFLERWADRLCFGTDYLKPGQHCPIIQFIREVDINRSARRRIMRDNARRVLRLK